LIFSNISVVTSPYKMTILDKLLFSKTAKASKEKAEPASPRHIEVHRRPSSEIASNVFSGSPRMSDSEQLGQVSKAEAKERGVAWSIWQHPRVFVIFVACRLQVCGKETLLAAVCQPEIYQRLPAAVASLVLLSTRRGTNTCKPTS
jgi:hypothetical protein